MKKYLSAVFTLLLVPCLTLTAFASHYLTNEAGGIWERGRNDGQKTAFSNYDHPRKDHGATSQTDLAPGTESRVCVGPGEVAESLSDFIKANSWHPYWHFCNGEH